MSRLHRFALLVVLLAVLAGCGKVGAVQPPPDADPAYPRQYPPPDSVVPQPTQSDSTADDAGDAQ